MIWQIAHGFDVEGGKASIWFRAPFLEISCLCRDGAGATPSMDSEDPSDRYERILAANMHGCVGCVSLCPYFGRAHPQNEPKNVIKLRSMTIKAK